jgi:dihydrofolate reductase
MHTSLDGFVGGPNGEMDWIYVDKDLFDIAAQLTDNADTALYGRVTYQMMDAYWPTAGDNPNASKHDIEHSTWYNKVNKIVVSRSMAGQQLKNTRIIGDNLASEVSQVKQQAGSNILIFGSPSASHALMQHDLIDDYWLFINPILLGQGIPLFKDIQERAKLKLVASNIFPSGIVALHYERQRD